MRYKRLILWGFLTACLVLLRRSARGRIIFLGAFKNVHLSYDTVIACRGIGMECISRNLPAATTRAFRSNLLLHGVLCVCGVTLRWKRGIHVNIMIFHTQKNKLRYGRIVT